MTLQMETETVLEHSRRVAERLLAVQARVNELIDSTQARLLPEVRRQLGLGEYEAADSRI